MSWLDSFQTFTLTDKKGACGCTRTEASGVPNRRGRPSGTFLRLLSERSPLVFDGDRVRSGDLILWRQVCVSLNTPAAEGPESPMTMKHPRFWGFCFFLMDNYI